LKSKALNACDVRGPQAPLSSWTSSAVGGWTSDALEVLDF
jgi:hypothetical protein